MTVFFLVDAFTEFPFKGNPAGVCLVDNFPSDSELQKISYYYNWSEIAFIKKIGERTFDIRWFSPKDEAPLCGHATLGASHVIFANNLVNGHIVHFKYKGGNLTAEKNCNDLITLTFPSKPVTICQNVPFSVKEILGISDYEYVLKDDIIYLVVLKSANDVKKIVPDFSAIKKVDTRAIAITAPGFDNFDFTSRYFAPKVGIYEDPVCGSMHCRLACYWQSILGKDSFYAHQASKRSGVLKIDINNDLVKISGKSITICQIYADFLK